MSDELGQAKEALLDVLLPLIAGKDDDDLVFVDGFLRDLRDELQIAVEFDEIEPMTVREFKERFRAAKEALAADHTEGNDER